MNKVNILLKQNRLVFHTTDLGLLWKIDNKNTLLTTIKRYVKKGILIRIHKGLYTTKPVDELDPYEVGVAYVHQYAYVSTESVLVENGLINQQVSKITLVCQVSRKFKIGSREYVARKMADKYLFNDSGVNKSGHIYKASVERAVVDMEYFNPNYLIDNKNLVDWERVSKIKKEMGLWL